MPKRLCTDPKEPPGQRNRPPATAVCRNRSLSSGRRSFLESIRAVGFLCRSRLAIAALLLLQAANPLDERSIRADDTPSWMLNSGLIENQLPAERTAEQSYAELPETVTADSRITELENQIRDLGTRVSSQLEAERESGEVDIVIGGAVRFQYVLEDYIPSNRKRAGDIDFDNFRIDFDGEVGGVLLSAQYRWYHYMDVIHHGWAGYQFNDDWQMQVGITRVPFGNLPYNSHNFFFSTNYYVGLEDDYDAGIKLIGDDGAHDLRMAFFKNDEMGGVDGFVDNPTDRYSYDVVGIRGPGQGIFDPPAIEIAEYNSWVVRYTYQYCWSEVGASFLGGQFRDRDSKRGDRFAYAIHSDTNIDRWNLKLQYTDYRYDVDGAGLLVVGAYSFYDTIPAQARLYTANIAYALPVDYGPVTELLFYNDFNVMADKSGALTENTMLNVAGVAVSAGGLYTYFDLLSAKNQPFVGGSMGSDSGNWNTRFNINVGYYF